MAAVPLPARGEQRRRGGDRRDHPRHDVVGGEPGRAHLPQSDPHLAHRTVPCHTGFSCILQLSSGSPRRSCAPWEPIWLTSNEARLASLEAREEQRGALGSRPSRREGREPWRGASSRGSGSIGSVGFPRARRAGLPCWSTLRRGWLRSHRTRVRHRKPRRRAEPPPPVSAP
jgi:hypothetical protein